MLARSAMRIARSIALCGAFGIGLLQMPDALAAPDDVLARLVEQTRGQRFVMVGEMHGTTEVPALVADLAERWARTPTASGKPQTVVVALEYPQSETAELNAYVDSDGGAAAKRRLLDSQFWSREYQDGRSSQAMFALIDALRNQKQRGQHIVVAAFDMNAAQSAARQDRDHAMAGNLRAIVQANPGARILVLTGNLHARQADGASWDPAHRFMAGYLTDLTPFSLIVNALHGDYWACSGANVADCKTVHFAGVPDHRAGLSTDDETKAIGYNLQLMLEQFSASLPARTAN